MKLSLFIVLFVLFTSSTTNIPNHYPIPKQTRERLFFIQRNLNTNTIVYDAKFDQFGNLDKLSPMDIYWIRYDENGQRMELRSLEKKLAYGIEFANIENTNNYKVNVVAEKSREIYLKQIAPFHAKAYLEIDHKMSQLTYLYLEAIDGIIPQLQSIEYFGIDTLTQQKTFEKVFY